MMLEQQEGSAAHPTTARCESASIDSHTTLRTRLHTLYATRLPELTVAVLALLLRFWRLGYHSVWFDESVSLNWAGADPSYTWRVTFELVQDKHPPLYYVGLHYWRTMLEPMGLARNDAALRAFGSLLGLLTVIAIMRLVTRLSDRATGLITGLLVALSPVLVWYSQELRMFQPATTAIVLGALCLQVAWETPKPTVRALWWAGMVAALSAALYTYLFSAFILPAAGLTVLLLALRTQRQRLPHWWRRLLEGIGALALTALIFLPLAANAWGVNEAESTAGRAFESVGPNLRHLLKVFTIWRVPWSDPWPELALLFLALLLLAGLFLPFFRTKQPSVVLGDRGWLLIWIGAPLLVANVLLSRSDSIFDEDRYLLFLAPFILWGIARGSRTLIERQPMIGWPAVIVTVLLVALPLPRLWSPAMFREHWRAATNYIVDYQGLSDGLPAAIVAHVDYTSRPVEWYLQANAPDAGLPLFFPFGGTLTPEQVDDVVAPPLNGIVDFGAKTLWLTQSHLDGVDDQRVVEGWLNANFPLVTEVYPAGIKVSGYALQSRWKTLPKLGEHAVHPEHEAAPGLTLAACEIMTKALSARDQVMHPPSGWVHVRLWWRADDVIGDDYVATAQMIGPEGAWGERLYRENEALRRWPTGTWVVGDIVRDEIDINLNPVTPPGEYPIVIGVMDSNGVPLGKTVTCGTVRIHDSPESS